MVVITKPIPRKTASKTVQQPVEKIVRIVIELDSEFVRLLNAQAGIGQWLKRSMGECGRGGLTAGTQLALAALDTIERIAVRRLLAKARGESPDAK